MELGSSWILSRPTSSDASRKKIGPEWVFLRLFVLSTINIVWSLWSSTINIVLILLSILCYACITNEDSLLLIESCMHDELACMDPTDVYEARNRLIITGWSGWKRNLELWLIQRQFRLQARSKKGIWNDLQNHQNSLIHYAWTLAIDFEEFSVIIFTGNNWTITRSVNSPQTRIIISVHGTCWITVIRIDESYLYIMALNPFVLDANKTSCSRENIVSLFFFVLWSKGFGELVPDTVAWYCTIYG